MADAEYDVVVLGAGPGGYVAAIRAGQLGMRTAVVERDELGGICLNWGCIPSKALLRNAEILSLLHRADEFGISFQDLHADFGHAIDRSRRVVHRLTRGVASLLKKNGVEVFKGEGRLKDAHTVEVPSLGKTLTTRNVIIATGARPRSIPPLPIDGEMVITSREALEMRQVPGRVAVVGGGATGVEFAYLLRAYGAQVTVVEMLPHLLPNEDEEISQQLERAFAKQGITVMTAAQVQDFSRDGAAPRIIVATSSGQQEVACDQVLVAVGVQPNSESIGLEALGIKTEGGFITIDARMATSVPGIRAIGDVTGKALLAHVAMAQGVAAVEHIAGLDVPELSYKDMPRATYCQPQVASFGLTEREAREEGYQVKVGRFPFAASGKALALGEAEGMVKIVADAEAGEVLGAHMIGNEVTELLGELSLARLLEGTTREVGWLVHSHPTLSEALKEAALAAEGRAIHI